jgi:hypothetical protein
MMCKGFFSHSRRAALGVLVLACGPAGASDGCPARPEDLEKGAAIAWDDGSTSVLQRDAEGLSLEATRYNDGSGEVEVARARHGYLLVHLTFGTEDQPPPGFGTAFSYPPEVLSGGPIAPGQSQEIEVTLSDGVQSYRERQRLVSGPPGQVTIGDCRYDSYPVEVVYLDLVPQESDLYDYIPALDTALMRGALDADRQPLYMVTPLSIHVLD